MLLWAMKPISYARDRFPPDVIRHAVWLYLRFTLSYRDVEDLLAERGLNVSNESIRRWVLKFGPEMELACRRKEVVLPVSGHSGSFAVAGSPLRFGAYNAPLRQSVPGWRTDSLMLDID
jgi:putative transposase